MYKMQGMPRALLVVLVVLVACGSPARPPPVRRTAPPTVTPTPTPSPSPVPTMSPCRYVFPLRPASTARYGRSHHDYPATDMFAPRGTDVVAVTDGRVDFVSRVDRWDPKTNDGATRGGLSVAIVGDDGVRYYGSHLRDVTHGVDAGSRVWAGEPIGHVDSSGDARGIAPHLHFGISHPTRPDDWRVRRGEVSPYEYLNAWRAGRAVTPVVSGAAEPTCKREGAGR